MVWLKVDTVVLGRRGSATPTIARCSTDDPAATLVRLNAEREPLYQEVADIVDRRAARRPACSTSAQVAAAVRNRLVDPGRA